MELSQNQSPRKKGKDLSNVNNKGPISFLSNFTKVFEIIVNQSLRRFTEENIIMPDEQFC